MNEGEGVGVVEAVVIECNYCRQGDGVGRLCYTCKVPLHQFCSEAISVNRGYPEPQIAQDTFCLLCFPRPNLFSLPDNYPGDSSSSSNEGADKVVVATDEYGIPWDIKHAKKRKVTAQVWNHVHRLHEAIEGNYYICLVCAPWPSMSTT